MVVHGHVQDQDQHRRPAPAKLTSEPHSTDGKSLLCFVSSELAKSEIYLECIPLFTRGLVQLPDL